MKLKKFITLVNKICKDRNCKYGKCPLADKLVCKDGTIVADCILAIDNADKWDAEDLSKRAREIENLVNQGKL